jgi:alkylation response protein AidB-like acyl-CoA dehydrogenase
VRALRVDGRRRRDARLAVTLVTRVAAEVATFAFHADGAGALYDQSPHQRSFRDIHAASRHIAATEEAYELAGRVLLDLETAHPLMVSRANNGHAPA